MSDEEREALIQALFNAKMGPSAQGLLRQQGLLGILAQQAATKPRLNVSGGGGIGQGVLSGGLNASYEVPVGGLQSLLMSIGGGGALGSVPTPHGVQKIREWSPEFGITYKRNF